ncbi:hypothetical protein ACKWTF_015274 [Chironomus riparius]
MSMIDIPCRFLEFSYRHGKEPYGCWIKDQEIAENQQINFIGQHLNGKTNNDVISIQFDSCTVTKIPQGLTKIFPNLVIFEIDNSKLSQITKNDLKEYKNLKKFICTRNELDFLPGDLFEGFENLEFISFWGNNLKLIDCEILDGLEKLNHVNFKNNPNYSKCYSIYQVYKSNASLHEVKVELTDKFPAILRNSREFGQEPVNIESRELKMDVNKSKVDKFELKGSSATIEKLVFQHFVMILLFLVLRK